MKMAAAHVPDDIIIALDEIAEQRGVERTKVIRWALIEYIERFSSGCLLKETNEPQKNQTTEPTTA
jgi:metal-responsive CopG/Arc/MetJ family transcriptional regulator